MLDALDLCIEQFEKIPSAWLKKLEAWNETYTPTELAEAFKQTKDGKGKSLRYTEVILERIKGDRTRAPAASEELPCDRCEALVPATDLEPRHFRGKVAVYCGPCAARTRDDPFWVLSLTPTARLVEAYWQSVTGVPA